ncbi:Nn.00g077030.m01.CDS01 [Neocucurbitaria sp. VM-36]
MARLPREDPLQRTRRNVASRISKAWRNDRKNRRPRGLANRGNDCYRIGALQPLLHLPRFVNWILQHNEQGQNWPCGTNDRNLSLPTDPLTRRILLGLIKKQTGKDKDQSLYTGCVPCLLKLLIIDYWGNVLIGPQNGNPPFAPLHLPTDHPAIIRLHRLIDRWFCVDPQGHSRRLKNAENKDKTPRQKERITIRARQVNMRDQQDSDEFHGHLFNGIRAGFVNNPNIHAQLRDTQYNALFSVRRRDSITCEACHGRRSLNTNEHFGFMLNPRLKGPDTIVNAIDRVMNGHRITDEKCPLCEVDKAQYAETSTIDAAPEYLRVFLSLSIIDEDDNAIKIRNHIQIPDILDLTRYMTFPATQNPWPVRYKLVSSTYHTGATPTSGHYVAGVTGPKEPFKKGPRPQYFCNDDVITDWVDAQQPNVITSNPAIQSNTNFDATIIFYERIPHGSGETKQTAGETDAVVETIAERVRTGKLDRQCKK